MDKTRLQYYEEYRALCWQARQYYKDESNKLLYWVGGVFIAIVGATGIFGANQGQKFSFSIIHVLLFHALFGVVWCYYLYKQLNVDLFQELGERLEQYLRSFYQMDEIREFRGFFGLKGHYLGKHAGHGRSLTKLANVGIVVIYLVVTSVPIFEGSILDDKISINWQFVVSSSVFAVLMCGAFLIYKQKRKQMIESIQNDWTVFLGRFPPGKGERITPDI